MKIIRADEFYNREAVAKDTKNLYIFTDNTDRDSGKGEISNDSWYSKKYGNGKHYPKVTSALIRGLDNAYPITTQRWYNKKHKGIFGRWTDKDIDEFKRIIDEDFNEITSNLGKYENIIFPIGGIFNSKIANISESRTPVLHSYLFNKCKELLSLTQQI